MFSDCRNSARKRTFVHFSKIEADRASEPANMFIDEWMVKTNRGARRDGPHLRRKPPVQRAGRTAAAEGSQLQRNLHRKAAAINPDEFKVIKT